MGLKSCPQFDICLRTDSNYFSVVVKGVILFVWEDDDYNRWRETSSNVKIVSHQKKGVSLKDCSTIF